MGLEKKLSYVSFDKKKASHPEAVAAKVGIAHNVVRAVDLLDLTGIFILSSNDVFKMLFEHLARYIMLPVAAASTILFSVFSWIEAAHAKEDKGMAYSKAVVETIGAATINAAVIGALASAAFTIGPYLFAAALGTKALFHAGASLYFVYKGIKSKDKTERSKFNAKAFDAGVGFLVGALAAAGVVSVIIFGHAALFALGVVAGVTGAAFAVFKTIKQARERNKRAKEMEGEEKEDLVQGSDNVINNTLSNTNQKDLIITSEVIPDDNKPENHEDDKQIKTDSVKNANLRDSLMLLAQDHDLQGRGLIQRKF